MQKNLAYVHYYKKRNYECNQATLKYIGRAGKWNSVRLKNPVSTANKYYTSDKCQKKTCWHCRRSNTWRWHGMRGERSTHLAVHPLPSTFSLLSSRKFSAEWKSPKMTINFLIQESAECGGKTDRLCWLSSCSFLFWWFQYH